MRRNSLHLFLQFILIVSLAITVQADSPKEVTKFGRQWKEWVVSWVDKSGNGKATDGFKEVALLIPSGLTGEMPVRGIHLLSQVIPVYPGSINLYKIMNLSSKTLKKNSDGSVDISDGNFDNKLFQMLHDNGVAVLTCGDSGPGYGTWSWGVSDSLRNELVNITGHPELLHAGAIMSGLSKGGRAAAGWAASGNNKNKVMALTMDVSTTYGAFPGAIAGVPTLYYASFDNLYEGTDRRSAHYNSTSTLFSSNYNWQACSALIDPKMRSTKYRQNVYGHFSPSNKYYQLKWLQGVINLRTPTSNTPNNFSLAPVNGDKTGFAVKCTIESVRETTDAGSYNRTYYNNIVIKKWSEFSSADKNKLSFWLPDAATVHEFITQSKKSGPTGKASEISITTSASVPAKDTSAPSKPKSLKASSIGGGKHSVSWTKSTDNESVLLYRIYLNNKCIAGIPATMTSYTFTELLNNQTYDITVEAVDTSRNSSGLSTAVSYKAQDGIVTNPTVAFTKASSAGSEGTTTVNIPVSLSKTFNKTVTVKYAVTGGDAQGSGEDYTLASGKLTFAAGTKTKNINIKVINDTLDENNESIKITLSAPFNAKLAATTVYTYTITDNDNPPKVSLSMSTHRINEKNGSSIITAKLSAASSKKVTVKLAYSGKSIGGGKDYSATDTIVIAAGKTSGSTSMQAVDDKSIEGDEAFIIDISSVTNGTENGTQRLAGLIIDDDKAVSATVGFSKVSSSSNEGKATATIPISLYKASNKNVTVKYTVTGGSAKQNTDYVLANGTLTIKAGKTTQNLSIQIKEDNLDETNENIKITLSNPTNATLASNKVHTFTIVDNDPKPKVKLTINGHRISEKDGTAKVTAQLSSPSSKTIKVVLGFSGTTIYGKDYKVSTQTILIKPGKVSESVTFTAIQDELEEGDEIFRIFVKSVENGEESGEQIVAGLLMDYKEETTYEVTFVTDTRGSSNDKLVQTVVEETAALAPKIKAASDWDFIGWDTDFSNVTSDLTITALYASNNPKLNIVKVSGVKESWKKISLPETYYNPVIITTPVYSSGGPLVTRIRNRTSNSFELRTQRADKVTKPAADIEVTYIVVEAGAYSDAEHGITLEAQLFESTKTDYKNNWQGQSLEFLNSYTHVAVFGQVMSYRDSRWSTFWSCNGNHYNPATADSLYIGKHVGEDPASSRSNETLGYIAVEEGTYTFKNNEFTFSLGDDTIMGFSNFPITYAAEGQLSVATKAAMDGIDGGWAVLFDRAGPVDGSLSLVIDEDTIGDSERTHVSEQVSVVTMKKITD
ncbi:MAG: hypothetical protein NE334_08925 [Lentisphaeraceae bacterium]|nr:hypothetical protein [Lentisphaeraceae bacterium]